MARKKIISTKMKIFMLALFISSISCFIAGFIVLSNSGFTLSKYFDTSDWFLGFNSYNENPNFNYSQSLSDIKSLTLDFGNAVSSDENISINKHSYSTSIENYSGDTLNVLGFTNNSNIITNGEPFIVKKENNILKITFNKDIFTNNFAVKFNIQIPQSYAGDLNITNTSGNVNLNNSSFTNLDIKSVNSDIQLDSIKSPKINLSTTNGNINTNFLTSNDLLLNTINGDANINNVSGVVKATAVNGDIFASLANPLSSFIANTTSGDVDISINDNKNLSVTYSTVNGDFTSNLANNNLPEHNENISFSIGDGSSIINVKTVTGDFTIYP
ncbi:hypothetical protein JCM1393_08680 [Clostridium carnis]